MNVIATIFVVKNLAISRHEHGDGIGQQQHPGGERACQAISPGVAHPGVLQVDGVHQVMQSNVSVTAAEARQQGCEQTEERIPGTAAERAEKQVEPDHVRLHSAYCIQNPDGAGRIVKRPATLHGKTFEFRLLRRNPVGEDSDAKKWIATQFFRDVKAVFAEPSLTGREGGHQTNFHYSSGLWSLRPQKRSRFDV